jgi:cell shape-determining protein MreC
MTNNEKKLIHKCAEYRKRIAELEAENAELKRKLQEAKEFLAAIHMIEEEP